MDNHHVISAYCQNCRSLRTKLHTLYTHYILLHNYDVIVLFEIGGVTFDNENIDSRYRVFRCDRDQLSTGRLDGGGVLFTI